MSPPRRPAGRGVPTLPAGLARILSDVARTAARVTANGWAEGAAGNLSLDVTGQTQDGQEEEGVELAHAFPTLAGRRLLLTASGARMRDLARHPERLAGVVQVAGDGHHLATVWADDRARFHPTSELTVHLAIHASLRRRGVPHPAVLHVHADALIALTHHAQLGSGQAVTAAVAGMLSEVLTLLPEGIGVLPYLPPGSVEQAVATARALEHHRLVLWARHGAVVTASTFDACLDLLEAAEKAARLWLMCPPARLGPAGAED